MNKQQWAMRLNGREIGKEIESKEEEDLLKELGIVVIYGASDDLMEIRGAINDEVSCYAGGVALFRNGDLLKQECESEDCPHEERLAEEAFEIKAFWDEEGFSWLYRTEIPHETFIIKEDEDNYCRGIIFYIKDIQ